MARITDKWRKVEDIDIPAPTQFSLRPTVRLTAQIHALMKLFPGQNKTDLINDLLRAGINKVLNEITGDDDYTRGTEKVRQSIDDYEDEDSRNFVTYYQEEVKSLLAQIEEKKGGKRD